MGIINHHHGHVSSRRCSRRCRHRPDHSFCCLWLPCFANRYLITARRPSRAGYTLGCKAETMCSSQRDCVNMAS
ncbi:uncharacterized protein SEPMUDRAFT_151971 [Sphaerulina musiva SO2202]|uniref:Uncharacterized protein n=1 Tax=Sphaerulina musiva (strain SO2202) TaxID=692275 RepID=M3C8R2_SPHMS|nr:uncharacterized protein SEPMUDRAFT_151971 [Sphaerulina musiva SO2202]EMF08270.1 hypothetical protein SEPMUDRAFT_151971 [Sphaerulina musiva SO2202]